MSHNPGLSCGCLTGHALRNANLRERSLNRAREAPPLAQALVTLRAQRLGMTRMEFARQSGISRGTLRDLELGAHTPTRRILQQFVDFCRKRGVDPDTLEEIQNLYAGAGDDLGQFIARLELRAGSPVELARRVGISPATLWEYRRGNFPLPLSLLSRLCQAVGEDPEAAKALWHEAERQRFLARGYPGALAEFWVLCEREGYAEKHLPSLGLGTAVLRRLRYLELPAWEEVAAVARVVCKTTQERQKLEELWRRGESAETHTLPDPFGSRLLQLRKQQGLTRREVADLFGVGGKKPARIIKSIEEDGCYSARAYPAGLAALVARTAEEQTRLAELWAQRRTQFHRRHRPETRTDLRLARELYGFDYPDMQSVLGYTPLEYQRIERGVGPLSEAARSRVLEAVHRAGRGRVEALLQRRDARDAARTAWRAPPSVRALVTRLAEREGGILPLRRVLRQAGLAGCWPERLRSIARGEEVPPWPLLERIAQACDVPQLDLLRSDWQARYRARLECNGGTPLGIELRLLIAEVAMTVRAFSNRLGINASVLIRDLQRVDANAPVKWYQVERILKAAGLSANDGRWKQVHAWWYSTRAEDS